MQLPWVCHYWVSLFHSILNNLCLSIFIYNKLKQIRLLALFYADTNYFSENILADLYNRNDCIENYYQGSVSFEMLLQENSCR